jgi:hypothetical protein
MLPLFPSTISSPRLHRRQVRPPPPPAAGTAEAVPRCPALLDRSPPPVRRRRRRLPSKPRPSSTLVNPRTSGTLRSVAGELQHPQNPKSPCTQALSTTPRLCRRHRGQPRRRRLRRGPGLASPVTSRPATAPPAPASSSRRQVLFVFLRLPTLSAGA